MSAYGNAKEALSGSYKIRKLIGATMDEPIAVVDAAIELGIHVSFVNIGSLEGMWCREKKAIVLTSLRSPGRRAFTCAHEIGHWYHNHGTTCDELISDTSSYEDKPEEKAANMLAGYLLMPPFGVPKAIQQRGWTPDNLSAEQTYTVASYFGVSYEAIVNQMRYALKAISDSTYQRLRESAPKKIRASLCPEAPVSRLAVVDAFWSKRPLDLDVGEAVLFPPGTQLQHGLFEIKSDRSAVAVRPGIGLMVLPETKKTVTIRVCAADYNGYAQFRFASHNNVYSRT